jgi:hypothetical protein
LQYKRKKALRVIVTPFFYGCVRLDPVNGRPSLTGLDRNAQPVHRRVRPALSAIPIIDTV